MIYCLYPQPWLHNILGWRQHMPGYLLLGWEGWGGVAFFCKAVPDDAASWHLEGVPCFNQDRVHVMRWKKCCHILQYPCTLLCDLSNILLSHALQSSHYVYVWPWNDGRLILVLTHIYICCWLSDSTKGASRSSCADSSLIRISRIFLFGILYLDASARRVSDTWTTDITYLRRSSWLMVTRRWKWNWGISVKLGLGEFNDENPFKGLRCVGWGGIQWWKPLKLRSVPVIVEIGEEY